MLHKIFWAFLSTSHTITRHLNGYNLPYNRSHYFEFYTNCWQFLNRMTKKNKNSLQSGLFDARYIYTVFIYNTKGAQIQNT